jgi:NAD+ synthase
MTTTLNLNDNYNSIKDKLIGYIQDRCGSNSVLIGLSGGIDSSLTSRLAIDALGADKTKVLIMTNSRYAPENLDRARTYARNLGLEKREVDSESVRQGVVKALDINDTNVVPSASIDARLCDMILKDIAADEGRIYLGTINGTERLTGWYPKGTLVGDYCPLGDLLKTQIKGLAQHTGLGYLLETVSHDASRICSGCGELEEFKGITYETLDKVLLAYETLPREKVRVACTETGIPSDVCDRILRRIDTVAHKQDKFPGYCKINERD